MGGSLFKAKRNSKPVEKLLNFLIEIGNLKEKKRRGWTIYNIKEPETTAEHIFHLAFLVWILGKGKRINLDRAIKMALIHDICEIYSPDFTSFDAVAIDEKKSFTMKDIKNLKPKIGRPTNLQRKKLEKVKRKLEARAMKKILSKLPEAIKKEMNDLWQDYENGITTTGRFVKQSDRIINLLQGLLYWKKYGKIQHDLWIKRIKEVIDDDVLCEFIKVIENKFCAQSVSRVIQKRQKKQLMV